MDESSKVVRDRALLLIGFAGGLRRSELVSIDVCDIERVRQGVVVTIRRSKTDQKRMGRRIGVPLGRSRWRPVAALDGWLERAGISEGPIFRPVDRHSRVLGRRLSPEAICLVVRERVAAAGFDPAPFSGHSLRAGLATSAAQAGVASWRVRQRTGHASDAMLARYIRQGELFVGGRASIEILPSSTQVGPSANRAQTTGFADGVKGGSLFGCRRFRVPPLLR
jgi:integrase